MPDARSPAQSAIIPTEPIGSIPRPLGLIEAFSATDSADPMFDPLDEEATRDTIAHFQATGSPVITDGEQRKYHNFGADCVDGLPNLRRTGWSFRSLVTPVAGRVSRGSLADITVTRTDFSILPDVLPSVP